MSLMCTEGFTLLNWGHVAAAHKRNKSQWCLTLTPNNIETIERMTCHCFLRPIWRDLTSRAPTQLFLFTQPYPFPQENNIYTLNSQIFVFPILALLVFINSILLHTYWKVNLFILSSQLDTECLGDFKGSIYSYIFTTLSQHYNQTNMKDIDYDNQTKW